MQGKAATLLGVVVILCAQAPVSSVSGGGLGEVDNVEPCPGIPNCLQWSAVPGATGYHVYRGALTDLPLLLDGDPESCLLGSYGATTTGSVLPTIAGEGNDWYIVTAWDAQGEGSPGAGTGGPRVLDSSGDCPTGDLVLNEVDYDQPGTDNAEFVEIYNPTAAPRDLNGVELALVNGSTSSAYERVSLADAGPTLAPHGYLVVGAPAVVAALPPGTPAVAFSASTNNIQNGAPDGLALIDTTTDRLLDALSYEGSITDAVFDGISGIHDLVEGTASSAADSNSVVGAVARFPSGSDTDDAATDWWFNNTPSPGIENPLP